MPRQIGAVFPKFVLDWANLLCLAAGRLSALLLLQHLQDRVLAASHAGQLNTARGVGLPMPQARPTSSSGHCPGQTRHVRHQLGSMWSPSSIFVVRLCQPLSTASPLACRLDRKKERIRSASAPQVTPPRGSSSIASSCSTICERHSGDRHASDCCVCRMRHLHQMSERTTADASGAGFAEDTGYPNGFEGFNESKGTCILIRKSLAGGIQCNMREVD